MAALGQSETFLLPLWNPLKGFQQNLTGSNISIFSTKFVFFSGRLEHKMAALASDWLRIFGLLLWNRWIEFNETWQEAIFQGPSERLCFSGRSEKQDGHPDPAGRLAEKFSTSAPKALNGIQQNLIGIKILTSSTKFVFFGPIKKKEDGYLGHWLAETLLTSPLKRLNGIQQTLTESKISTSFTKFVGF